MVSGEGIGTIGAAASVNVIYGSLGISINAGGLGATVPLSGFGRADDIWTQDIQTLKILEELTTGLVVYLPRYLDLNQIKTSNIITNDERNKTN
ncbi:MAG: hypothetical protein ACRD4W_01195 [Nitrososphaeraceae archaeon]